MKNVWVLTVWRVLSVNFLGNVVRLRVRVGAVELSVDFSGVGCDYKFAADFVRHFVRLAKLGHLANAFYGQLRFCGAGFVIQTTMQDAAVVAGLMLGEGGFFFQQSDGRGGECLKMFVGGG